MESDRHILLTFDLEEFDLPLEYGCSISPEDQMKITSQGIMRVNALLEKYNIKATYFVTSVYALANRSLIKQICSIHEIASHSYSHSQFNPEDYARSKQILEEISQVQVKGFRMPRLARVDFKELKRCGYNYDSSLNPTYIPFRYNNLRMPRTLFNEPETGLKILPASVSPLIRFPLFWLSFKNIPLTCYFHLCKRTLINDNYLHLYFHPWEFADIKMYKIPTYLKRQDGDVLISKLENLLLKLKKQGEFTTISEFIENRG